MFYKKIMILLILLISLMAISTVSAAENNTDEMAINSKDILKIDNNNNDESEIKNNYINYNTANSNENIDEKF